MMTMFSWATIRRLRPAMGIFVLIVPMLAACEKPTVPVSVHGVNYSENDFSYVVIDPDNPKNAGGGELIAPYAAGGTTCCYELPRKWRAGMKVTINSTYSVGKLEDKTFREVPATATVEVPRYLDGKPGELWVLRGPDGTMDIISSNFQPDHPKWPGKVKGWPIPSLAYQREQWDLYIKNERENVQVYEELLAELKEKPAASAKESWDHFLDSNQKKMLEGYSGPDDPRFRDMLQQDYTTGLQQARTKMDQLVKGRP